MCWVYVLRSLKDGRFYIGSTPDIEDRLKRHSEGRVKATQHRRPLELVYSEKSSGLSEARSREREIKKEKSRKYIERLIRKGSLKS
jgi:putative endonuclease